MDIKNFILTPIGRFRLIAFFEGISLIVLFFIAVPLKYITHNPYWVKTIGPIHGVLFIVFVIQCYQLSNDLNWKFKEITWKVLLSSFLPFGTFYIDHTILRHLQKK